MLFSRFVKAAAGIAVLALLIVAGILSNTRVVKALDDDDNERDESRIRRGFEIAPVHLNLSGKNHALVGLGSYIVNEAGCNDCHSAGPQTEFLPGHNPFMGQPEKLNPATYLGGGRDFGAFPAPAQRMQVSGNVLKATQGRLRQSI
jgi:hypothetical protein